MRSSLRANAFSAGGKRDRLCVRTRLALETNACKTHTPYTLHLNGTVIINISRCTIMDGSSKTHKIHTHT